MREHERRASRFWDSERVRVPVVDRVVAARERVVWVNPKLEAAIAEYSARKRAGREGAPVGQEEGGK